MTKPTVEFLGSAKDEVQPKLISRIRRELESSFPEASNVTLCK